MLSLFNIILFFLLALVIREDATHRAVHWFLFPLIFMCLLVINFSSGIFLTSIKDVVVTLIFLAIQILSASLYFLFKERRPVNIFSNYFGSGDLLFLISISAGFSFINFIAFYSFSLFVILLLFSIAILAKKESWKYQIPLAGAQATIYLFLLITNMAFHFINLHDDSRILSYVSTLTR